MSNEPEDRNQLSQSQSQQKQNQLQQQRQQFFSTPEFQKPAPFEQGFFDGYSPAPLVYDEQLDSKGQTRAHWERLHEGLTQMGVAGMNHRLKQIRRMIHQNGIAFSAYGDPTDRAKDLRLDPLPNLIPADQWNGIEAALFQRATLLNLMLADLHGPRTLIRDKVLPPEVIFKHPHYQLPYHGLPAPGGRHLHFYSAELIRVPSGEWWVMADRTDSPGGCGFALENRLAISRAFPNEFRTCNVQRLAPYFVALREHLASLSKRNRENPHIALLSAGAKSASYFEDSFLARYLGFTLVEANDLVVRSGRVQLKTLAGLVPIDVIMRRQEGNHLDPLELGGGAPGVAGLLQVIRSGNVAIASAPGSGMVESPILMAFLPRVCQALLGTDLLMGGVATWWGGESSSLELILDRIDHVNLVPAFRKRTVIGNHRGVQNRINPQTLPRETRIELLRANPGAWVGQERVARSSAAVWENESLRAGHISMRAFLTASGDSWCSLPGGLTRVSDSVDHPIRNPFAGGGTKDTWVLADKPLEHVGLLKRPGELFEASRSKGFLPSRVADNLCWLGRYLERCEASARLIRTVVVRLTGEVDPEESLELPVLIRALALEGQIDVGYAIKEFSRQLPALNQSLVSTTLDHSNPNSLRSLVDQVVLLASLVRERMSADAWRIVQEMNNNLQSGQPSSFDLVDLLEVADTLIVDLAAFSGLVSESMTRTHSFQFLSLGRRLEHALQISKLLKNCFSQKNAVASDLLESVLEVADSILTYRSRYYANLQLPAVLDLLLIDEMNPRSLAFQLVELNANLDSLPGSITRASEAPDRRLAMDALHSIRMANVAELCVAGKNGERENLIRLMEKVEATVPAIFTAISNRYLVHSGPITQMIADEIGDSK